MCSPPPVQVIVTSTVPDFVGAQDVPVGQLLFFLHITMSKVLLFVQTFPPILRVNLPLAQGTVDLTHAVMKNNSTF